MDVFIASSRHLQSCENLLPASPIWTGMVMAVDPVLFWIQITTAGKVCHVYDTNSTFRGSSSADNYPLIFQSSLSLSPYLLPPPYLVFVILSLWSVKLYFMPMFFLAFFWKHESWENALLYFSPLDKSSNIMWQNLYPYYKQCLFIVSSSNCCL